MTEAVWEVLQQCKDVTTLLGAASGYGRRIDDLEEVNATVLNCRQVLVPFVSSTVNDVAFDVCLHSISKALTTLQVHLNSLSTSVDTNITNQFILLFRADFLLSQRTAQFHSLFCPSVDGPATTISIGNIIQDRVGQAFWVTSFGENVVMVSWRTFLKYFESYLGVSVDRQEDALKLFIDFTHDDFVTPYEFNLFLRCFGPLTKCVEQLLKPYQQLYLLGHIPAYEATQLLQGKAPGTFLVRFSKSHSDAFALTFVDRNSAVKHCLLFTKAPYGIVLKGSGSDNHREFDCLDQFIQSFGGKLKTPIGEIIPPQVFRESRSRQTPSSEHRELAVSGYVTPDLGRGNSDGIGSGTDYGSGGDGNSNSPGSNRKLVRKSSIFDNGDTAPKSSAERQCTVCMDAEPDVVFIPCGHLCCCRECGMKLASCPLCRNQISQSMIVYTS